MGFYRKKPPVVQAVQWDGTREGAQTIFARFGGKGFSVNMVEAEPGLYLHQPDGTLVKAVALDYLIKNETGAVCICKPDIFEVNYELA